MFYYYAIYYKKGIGYMETSIDKTLFTTHREARKLLKSVGGKKIRVFNTIQERENYKLGGKIK